MKHYNKISPFSFPPISPYLTDKHQTFIEINQSAFNHNSTYYKQLIGHHNNLAIVIKGNGYGHGLEQMGYLCEQNQSINWLCTAYLSEALQLRNKGITKPILILGYADINPKFAAHQNITFMVDTLEYAQKLNVLGKETHYQFPIHIKIDTGLSRLGVVPQDVNCFIQQLQALPFITINGIFSHFIASDNNLELTKHQINLFTSSVQNITHLTSYIHMSNTVATATLKYSSLFNFFRVGLGIYGFGNPHVQPILNWKTHIVAIKTVPAHSYVSYACTYKTNRLTQIALLPIGYSDGYQLRFSNITSVFLNNNYAPVIGRIGMNITIIDITDCPASIDDEVVLVGSQESVRATNLSQTSGIINVREFLTGIHPNIARIIV